MLRWLRALFGVYVVATAVHIGWIVAHEPFAFDAWNVAVDTGAKPFTLRRFFSYWAHEYTHSNPRIGQPATYLAYKLTWFAPIVTPLAFVALTLAVFVLGTGRWPRRGRDLALWALAIGSCWFALPQIGKTMFCRAYCANYLYGAAIQLWFLVPLRLGVRATPVRVALIALAGVVAGLCNEHTGPVLCLGLVVYAWRSRGRVAIAAAAGAIVGFAAIFFAPGQGERYDGLAQQASLVGRLLQRGVIVNLEIVRDGLLGAAPLLALIVIAMVVGRERPKQALRLVGGALVVATLVTMTIFVSPKLGSRFFIAPMALLLAAFIAVADELLVTPRLLAPFVAFAVVASIYAGARTIPLYGRLADASQARITALEASKPDSVYTAEAFEQVEDSWWFLGDDFRDIKKRRMVIEYFGLKGLVFRAYDPDAPLGVSDVRLVPQVGSACLPHFELDGYRALDIATLHHATLDAIRRLDTAPKMEPGGLAPTGGIDHLDLTVEFAGAPPAFPAPLLLSRWTPARFEHYEGAIRRESHSSRAVDVPKELGDADLYVFHIAGRLEHLDASHRFSPWGNGIYWALACRRDACFVFAATRIGR